MSSTLGVLIREARERARLTQADLAKSACTSQPAMPNAIRSRPAIKKCVNTSPDTGPNMKDARPAAKRGARREAVQRANCRGA